MIDQTLDTPMSEAETAARALLDRRIALIRELTTATTELEPLQRAAAEGEQRVRDAWADALAGGWTADELRSIGLTEPDRKPAAKKSAPKPRTTPPAPAAAAPTPAQPTPATPVQAEPEPTTPAPATDAEPGSESQEAEAAEPAVS